MSVPAVLSFTLHNNDLILVCFDCTIRFAFVLQGVVTFIDTSGAKHKLEVLELDCNFEAIIVSWLKFQMIVMVGKLICSYKPCTQKL